MGDAPLTVGVLRETVAGERRVAIVPDGAATFVKSGAAMVVERGAGAGAFFPDSAYEAAGAEVVDRPELIRRSDVLLCVRAPVADDDLRPGQVLIGLLAPLLDAPGMAALAHRGVTAISLDRLPRTLSRAQSMDALTSQANIAGYKAVLVAAGSYTGYFPMLMTAAGTVRPAVVLVLGAGVAGLQAIGTARRLGAIVNGYDVRPEARGDIESLGGKFLDLGPTSVASEGGYARALTDAETRAQQQALAAAIARNDVVITTAQVPGARPPVLVTAEAVAAMRSGSVIVDLAAGPLGGNVDGSQPDTTVVTDNGVTIIGAGNLPSSMAAAASTAYSRNISALLAHLRSGGELTIDTADEIQAGVVITHGGTVVNAATAALLTSGGAS
ncbi:MAG: H+-translocating transhydrogenase subunit alpha [Frankiaceae bacterium]|jgi:NAD(P) transhydrogenase subunit alpha|nr:H+-translocating transhydrogenase subunit alpha [Frankiaceae bacterium]